MDQGYKKWLRALRYGSRKAKVEAKRAGFLPGREAWIAVQTALD